jgi:PAS domain S-box-containing protein
MGKVRVLVVEDEPIIGMDIRNILQSLDYEVPEVILSGEEAIEKAEELRPDLIIMDIVLSGKMDGIEAVKRIKEKLNIPIIYLTAHTEEVTFERASETRPYGYLVKPVGKNDLYTAIETAIHRHEMGMKLVESEDKYRNILDNIEEGYFEVDLAGNYTFFNDSLCRIYGYSGDELLGMSYKKIMDDSTSREVYEAYNRVYRTKEPLKAYVREIIRKDGSRVFVEASVSLIMDSSGEPLGFRGIVRDITERKLAEEEVRKSEEKYRTYIRDAPNGVFILDREGRFIEANRAAHSDIGYTEEELLSMSVPDILSPNGQKENFEHFNRLLSEGGSSGEVLIRKKDGTDRYFFVEAVKLSDDRFIGFSIDINKRKQVEEALRESEIKYRTMIEKIEDGYYEVDLAGNYTFFNESLCRIHGYSRDELMGMNYKQYLDDENAQRVFKTFNEVYMTGKPTKAFDWEIIRKDGSRRFIEDSIALKCDASGRPTGFLGIVRDITERKKAGDRIKESLEEKEILLKEIHHRIKNNFQIITSLLRLQEGRFKNKGLLDIYRNSQNRIRAMALVHERLYQSEDLARIDLDDYIRIIAAELYQVFLIDPKRIELDINTEKVYLGIDKAIPCGLIINELLSNSIKHAFPKELKRKGRIKISLKKRGDELVELGFSDNGVGIPEDFDIGSTDSLGLKLVSLLTGQLKGEFNLARRKGTEVSVIFNAKE